MQGIGTPSFIQHRPLQGTIKTITIRRDGTAWYVCFSGQSEAEIPPAHTGPAVGSDVGLEYFAPLSTDAPMENPRSFRKSEKRLAKAHRSLSALANRDSKRRTARKRVAKAHRKVTHQRHEFAHKLSRTLVNTYRLIAVEDVQGKGLAASGLAKSVQDAAWSAFLTLLGYKVEETGSRVVKVDPRPTSQTCPECGAIRKKELSERVRACPCGCTLYRDTAAACVILSRGLATSGATSVEAVALNCAGVVTARAACSGARCVLLTLHEEIR